MSSRSASTGSAVRALAERHGVEPSKDLGQHFLVDPNLADAIVREGQVDLVMLGRPMLANPHWPVYAAMVLGEERPYDMLPVQFSTWLNKYQRSRVNNGFGRVVGADTDAFPKAAE